MSCEGQEDDKRMLAKAEHQSELVIFLVRNFFLPCCCAEMVQPSITMLARSVRGGGVLLLRFFFLLRVAG